MKLVPDMVAVVTGAASGIGNALAQQLARRGLKLVLGDIDDEALAKAESALLHGGHNAIACRCDVSVRDDVEALRALAIERFGQVDLVCNNAGMVLPFRPMWEHAEDEWRRIIDVNLWGVINGIQAFVPHLVKQGRGHVLNTASMAGVSIIPFNGPYNATKHAVVSLTETLAGELSRCAPGVGATVLCPGRVETGIGASESGLPRTAVAPTSDPPLQADPVAKAAIAGVEADRLYVFTNAGSRERVETRVEAIRRDLTTD